MSINKHLPLANKIYKTYKGSDLIPMANSVEEMLSKQKDKFLNMGVFVNENYVSYDRLATILASKKNPDNIDELIEFIKKQNNKIISSEEPKPQCLNQNTEDSAVQMFDPSIECLP